MKIKNVRLNNRRKAFEIKAARRTLSFPYAKAEPAPTRWNRIARVFVDPELGQEGFTYVLENGDEGSVLMDHVLNYNADPSYLRDLFLYRLTVEAQDRIDACGLSRREIIRRLRTSPAQLYRLLDQTNYRKSVDRMLALLDVLDCDVDVVVRERGHRSARSGPPSGL